MDRWPVQQRIFCVEQYLVNKSIVAVQCEFRKMYGEIDNVGVAASRKIISRWVQQWRETGSVQNKPRVRQKTVRTPENVQRVRVALEMSPPVIQHSKFLNLSDRSVRRILHD